MAPVIPATKRTMNKENTEVREMKKKLAVGITCIALVCAMAAAAGGQTLAAEWRPSRTQSEVGVSESTTTTTTGTTIAVTTPTGSQVQDASAAVIQVTPVSETLAANAAVDAANPGATGVLLAAAPTDSGLSYAANGQLNNLYNQVTAATSTEQLLADTAPAAASQFQAAVGESADAYTPIALYDVAASPSAETAIAQSGSVQVAISVPGVANGTQLVAVCWDRNGNSYLVPVRVVNGVVYLTVRSSGPVMIMARSQVQG